MTDTQAKAPAVVLTKEEKLAKIAANIAALQRKYDDVLNDRVTVKVAKIVYLPAIGDKVLATVGRTTPTTQAKVVLGTVIGVKHPEIGEDGKPKGAVQVRVRIYEGEFEEQAITVYPGTLQPATVEPVEGEQESNAS